MAKFYGVVITQLTANWRNLILVPRASILLPPLTKRIEDVGTRMKESGREKKRFHARGQESAKWRKQRLLGYDKITAFHFVLYKPKFFSASQVAFTFMDKKENDGLSRNSWKWSVGKSVHIYSSNIRQFFSEVAYANEKERVCSI